MANEKSCLRPIPETTSSEEADIAAAPSCPAASSCIIHRLGQEALTSSRTRHENALLRAEIEKLKLQLSASANSSRSSRSHSNLHADAPQKYIYSDISFKSASKTSLTRPTTSSKTRVEMDALKRDLAALQRASATRLRLRQINQMLQEAQELDLAFLFDATSSMQAYIEIVKQRIVQIAEGISGAFPESTLRVAYAYYRDYGDVDPCGSFDFTTSFNGVGSRFVKALAGVRAMGGGDAAEDVYSGFEELAKLSWKAHNRVVYHIADAPCHGRRFHDGCAGDNHPGGDLKGRDMQTLLRKLRKGCQVSTYTFLHINQSTRKMLQELKVAAGARDCEWICEDEFNGQNLESIPSKVVSMCTGTVAHSLKAISSYAKLTSGGGSLKAGRHIPRHVKSELPAWDEIAWQEGQVYKFKWYSELDKVLQHIQEGRPLQLQKTQSIQVQIAPYPFSEDGATRWPFYAQVMTGEYDTKLMVVKRFKDQLGTDTTLLHGKAKYIEQMEVQAVSAQLADDFNRHIRAIPEAKQVAFTLVSTLEMPSSTYYNMEKVLSGIWTKFNSNAGYVNGKGSYTDTLQAFSHWTHKRSKGMVMVTDLQGVQISSVGTDAFLLCDLAIHSRDVLRFTRTNLGEKGFELFFKSHKCNGVCHGLGLSSPTGM